MKVRALVALAATVVVLSACSFESKNEQLADRITKAVMANDLGPVKNDINPKVNITRSQIANAADELNDQGKLESIKENPNCDAGWHCFDVKFEKHMYTERFSLDENGKITHWKYHIAN